LFLYITVNSPCYIYLCMFAGNMRRSVTICQLSAQTMQAVRRFLRR